MSYGTTEPRHVQDAPLARIHGDADHAYEQLRQTLITNPTNVAAWLAMSTLVDDPNHAQECLTRVLALDPQNQNARAGLEQVRLKQLLASVHAPTLHHRRAQPRQLGEQLIAQGLITAEQLRAALAEQQRRKSSDEIIKLGDLLLEWGWIVPHSLARALIIQLQAQTTSSSDRAPWFLGQYLIAAGAITLMQLEEALEAQIRLRLAGQRIALGQLLIRMGYLSQPMLQQALDDQHAAFNRRDD